MNWKVCFGYWKRKAYFLSAQQAGGSYQLPQIFQRIIAGCVEFKNFANEAKSFGVFIDCVL